MSNPKYSIGEEVTFTSLTHPQFNGVYTIEDVLPINCKTSYNGSIYDHGPIKAHNYDIGLPSEDEEITLFATECELKKRYPPSTQSYTEIMKALKTFSIS